MRALLLFIGLSAFAALSQTNLLVNGGFETGAVSPWSNLAGADISATGAFSGTYCVHLTAGSKLAQQTVSVTKGKTYVLTGRFKWVSFGATDWGYWEMGFDDAHSVNSRGPALPQNTWNKVAISITATGSTLQPFFGVFGPQTAADLWFDDFNLFEKSVNLPPVIDPQAAVVSSTVPARVDFTANGDDPDGAIRIYQWDFGDGSGDNAANPSHTYLSAGTYTVFLDAYDNDNARTHDSVAVTVTATGAMALAITTPSTQAAWQTSSVSCALGGTASASSGGLRVTSMVWDNINTGDAGFATFTPAQTVNWSVAQVSLKPGRNEFLATAGDSLGRIATGRIVITRQVSAPVISAIASPTVSVPVFGLKQITFNLATVAENTFFAFDSNPPNGVRPGIGVLAEGVFTSPTGHIYHQPAFWRQDVTVQGSGGSAHYFEESTGSWMIRFSPAEAGPWTSSIHVKDASGEATVSGPSFTATGVEGHGFLRVSQDDPRYFEYSDRTFFWPVGPLWCAPDSGSGANFDRPWMGGSGMYSTNWARWISTAKNLGNEGVMSRLNFREHYPGHELSQEIFYPSGKRMWMGWLDDAYCPCFKNNTNYRVKIRLKAIHLAGPANASFPWGFVIKTSSWPSDTLEAQVRSKPSMIPRVQQDRDWHTILANYQTSASENSYINLYLENMTAGEVYVDEFSVREVLSGNALGGEMIRNPKADMHTYVEQRPAAYFDSMLAKGERFGQAFRFVVHDKNDWIQNHLVSAGTFAPSGDGYYQPQGTKAHFLLEQWWRYLCARYGHSTAVHSWELNNEGPPDDGTGSHARMTQEFAAFLHRTDAHPHMASTSFWSSWEPSFWGDKVKFPDVDYADIHQYTNGDTLQYDMAAWHLNMADTAAKDSVRRPIIRNETGISTNFGPIDALKTANPGVWFHNLSWVQLNVAGMMDPGYWFSEHFAAINADTVTRVFGRFMRRLDINKGDYEPVGAQVSDPSIRAVGQKNLVKGTAYFWVQNSTHTWARVMGLAGQGSVVPKSGTVTFTMTPNLPCRIRRVNTCTGAVIDSQTVNSAGNGAISITVSNLNDDFAVTVNDQLFSTAAESPVLSAPAPQFSVGNGYPNPSGRGIALSAFFPKSARVAISVYDIHGQLVAQPFNGRKPAGLQTLVWNGRNTNGAPLPSGLYFIRMKLDNRVYTVKNVKLH